jgi:hypothetical protein
VSTPLGTQRQYTPPLPYAHTRPPILSATREQAPRPRARPKSASRRPTQRACSCLGQRYFCVCQVVRYRRRLERAASGQEKGSKRPKSSLRNRAQLSAEGPQARMKAIARLSSYLRTNLSRWRSPVRVRRSRSPFTLGRFCCPVGGERSFAWTNRGPPANTKYLQIAFSRMHLCSAAQTNGSRGSGRQCSRRSNGADSEDPAPPVARLLWRFHQVRVIACRGRHPDEPVSASAA